MDELKENRNTRYMEI